MKKQRYGYFPDDCWELIFHKLREDDERDLDSISLVSKRFLSISNRVKLSLNVNEETLPLLPKLLRRFRHIKTIVFDTDIHKDIDGVFHQISQSSVMNLQAIKFCWFSTKPPRDGFKALALNKNIKNNLKVLDCSRLISIQDKDLVLIADCFPRLEELRISAHMNRDDDKVAACITDDGVDALASKLKELKAIEFAGDNCFITDKSLISLSTNCVKLRKIGLFTYSSSHQYVTGDGIDFVIQHSPNLTSLSLNLWSLKPCAFSFKIDNAFTNAKNLHSLTMSQQFISEKNIRLVAKVRPPLKKLVLIDLGDQYPEIHGALKLLLQACQLTLEELTVKWWPLTDTDMGDLAKYLSNLTWIDLDGCFGLTSVTFYTLTKSCPLLEVFKMARTRVQAMDNFSPDYLHKNYHMRHLDISGNMWLTDTTLQMFGQVCPNLQFLGVSHCPLLTSFSIGEVLKRCLVITQLDIEGLRVSDVFGKYSNHFVVNLKTLKAGDTEINNKGMAMIGNRCPNLIYLDIRFCNKVTDKGVMEVMRNCKRLRDVNLYGCEKVRTYNLPKIVFSRPSLRNIDLPSYDYRSEQMRKIFLSFGCRVGTKFGLNS